MIAPRKSKNEGRFVTYMVVDNLDRYKMFKLPFGEYLKHFRIRVAKRCYKYSLYLIIISLILALCGAYSAIGYIVSLWGGMFFGAGIALYLFQCVSKESFEAAEYER